MRRPIVFVSLICGLVSWTTCANAGTLWTVGRNGNGQLGDGTETDRTVPVPLAFTDVTAIAAGQEHSLFLRSDGSVWAMGFNVNGALGTGDTASLTAPAQMPNGTGAAAIATGYYHSLVVRNDGTLWGTGWNAFGQLGDTTTTTRLGLVQVPGAASVVAAEAGAHHTLYLQSDGLLFGMGGNSAGQLGEGTFDDRPTPKFIYSEVKAIAAGGWHSLFVRNDGRAYAVGLNDRGQLGTGNTTTTALPVEVLTDVVAVAAGDHHSLFLKSDGTLWAAGANGSGQLGDGTVATRNTPVQVASDVAKIAAGGAFSMFTRTDGSLWVMGHNTYGQLGDGTKFGSFAPIAVAGGTETFAGGGVHALWSLTSAAFGIGTHPKTQTVLSGDVTLLFALPSGIPAATATYQWQRDGVDLAGETSSFYFLSSTQKFHEGSYSVNVTSGATTVASNPAVLTVGLPPASGARLLNASTRTQVLTGDGILIPGFIIQGSGNKRMLLRTVGPGLTPFGVQGVLADPQMVLKQQQGGTFVDLATNNNWGTNDTSAADLQAAFTSVGAFNLAGGSNDAVLLRDLAPNSYTITSSGVSDGTGVALCEIYDAAPAGSTSRLVNLSSRGQAATGDNVMILGFVISSEGPLTLLLRGVGPTLGQAPHNVAGVIADPMLTLYRGTFALFSNDDWESNPDSANTAQIAAQVGAFALPSGSKDAAFVVTLQPGSYTVKITGATGGTGIALAEVYVVQ